MAFDAGFTAAVVKEIAYLSIGARVEKLFQPTRDSLLLNLRLEKGENGKGQSKRLLIDCGSTSPRICFTETEFENPKVPPMFCMLLRKHLSSARITGVEQIGFERVVKITLESRDELGYLSNKYIYAEIMGKFSNLVFCDAEERVISAFHLNDLSSSFKRPLISGIKYELPPPQEGKISPLNENKEGFMTALLDSAMTHAKFIQNRYCGVSPLVARELAFLADGSDEALYNELEHFASRIKNGDFLPVMIKDENGLPLEYSFMPITQYIGFKGEILPSFSSLVDSFFDERSRNDRIRQRASDILKLLTNADSRLRRRISLQEDELEACKDKDSYKRSGDLITSNIYMLKRGMTEVSVVDYYDEACPSVTITLDSRLSPAQNAQRYYKKYNKCKSAEIHLREQIEQGKTELDYLDTVFDSLSRAENEADLNEIRKELYESGYASRMKNYTASKMSSPKPTEYRTSGGWRVLCGKNNAQNEYITHKVAGKGDLWFHVKDYPGSHVVLLCDGEEPDATDFTEAAIIAAVNSKAPNGQRVTVDYTRVKNLKKPPNAKPGFVTFGTNWSAYVIPDQAKTEAMRVKKG